MTSIISSLLDDTEKTRRLAWVMLNHVGPKNKADAIRILKSRIGIYTNSNDVISNAVDRYFQ